MPFLVFAFPCSAEEGSDRVCLVGIWCPSRVNPTQLHTPKCWERTGIRSNSDAYLTTHVLHSHGLAQRTLGVPADKNAPQIHICPSGALCHAGWSGSGETRTALVLNHRIDLFCETFLGLSVLLSVPYLHWKRGGLASLSKFSLFKEHGITTLFACQELLTFLCSLWDCCVIQKEAGVWVFFPPFLHIVSVAYSVCNIFIISHYPVLIPLQHFIHVTLRRTYLVTCKTKFLKYEVPVTASRWLHELNQQVKWHSMDHGVYCPVLQKSSHLWMHPKPKLLLELQKLRECMLH